MTNKEIVQALKLETAKALMLTSLDPVVWAKAMAKARRWMKGAYGSADLEMFMAENGYSTMRYYYEETLREANGVCTVNREMYNEHRRDMR
jgi:hypothetical protein